MNTVTALGDRYYRQSQPLAEQCSEDIMAITRHCQLVTDRQGQVTPADLTAANDQMATVAVNRLTKLLGQLVGMTFKKEKLQY